MPEDAGYWPVFPPRVGEGPRACLGCPPEARELRLLCDEMLARLGRYLRAAGYDTLFAFGGAPDRVWVEQARSEHRLLLTCDRRLLLLRGAGGVVRWLPQGELESQAALLRECVGVDWLWRPFTRCLIDNLVLAEASPGARLHMPSCLRASEARECPGCRRIYWAGSHHRRMHGRLARWRNGESLQAGCARR